MPPDALIFDLDGTLWDTTKACAVAWNRVLARLGIAYRQMTAADVAYVAGRAHAEAIERAFVGLGPADLARIAEETATEDNAEIARRGGNLYPGVGETVRALSARLPLMIVSNCQRGYIELFLEHSGLARHFADLECWGNTGRGKTDNLRSVVERNRLSSPLFVGDTEGDREAAHGCALPFVFASYGFGHVARFEHRIDRFDQLLALLG